MPKPRLVGFALSAPGATPVPDNATLRLGFDPLDVIDTLPLVAPLLVGANFTLKEVLCPAFKVTGNVSPLILNPVPLALAAEIVRLDPPEFVSVSVRLELLPS